MGGGFQQGGGDGSGNEISQGGGISGLLPPTPPSGGGISGMVNPPNSQSSAQVKPSSQKPITHVQPATQGGGMGLPTQGNPVYTPAPVVNKTPSIQLPSGGGMTLVPALQSNSNRKKKGGGSNNSDQGAGYSGGMFGGGGTWG